MGLGMKLNFVVSAFPSVLICPEEREPDRCFLLRHWKVDKFDIDTRGNRSCIGGMQPLIGGPMQQEGRFCLYLQPRADRNRWHLTIELPHFDFRTLMTVFYIPMVCRFNQLTVFAFRGGMPQLHVLRMGP